MLVRQDDGKLRGNFYAKSAGSWITVTNFFDIALNVIVETKQGRNDLHDH